MTIFNILVLFSSFTLSAYGLSCYCSRYMALEFERYGLPQFRVMVGVLEFFGGLGLIVGFYEPLIGLLAASGLSLLLLGGFIVRVIIKDGVLKSAPAFFYFLLNTYLASTFLSRID